jgi:hypothetical protein
VLPQHAATTHSHVDYCAPLTRTHTFLRDGCRLFHQPHVLADLIQQHDSYFFPSELSRFAHSPFTHSRATHTLTYSHHSHTHTTDTTHTTLLYSFSPTLTNFPTLPTCLLNRSLACKLTCTPFHVLNFSNHKTVRKHHPRRPSVRPCTTPTHELWRAPHTRRDRKGGSRGQQRVRSRPDHQRMCVLTHSLTHAHTYTLTHSSCSATRSLADWYRPPLAPSVTTFCNCWLAGRVCLPLMVTVV